ncbi:MAG: thioredoxin fold domain-containing protein [Salibacteraceae bacterium]
MKSFVFTLFIALSVTVAAQDEIKWMTWDEALQAQSQEQKVIFVDVYTNWCGWCKKMDATTFKNPEVVEYMNKHYYAVKFNAESKDTFYLGEQVFVNEGGSGRRSPHQLAVALLDGKMSYPSYAFIGQPWNKSVAPGYMGARDFMCVLRYFVEGAPNGQTYEEFVNESECRETAQAQ